MRRILMLAVVTIAASSGAASGQMTYNLANLHTYLTTPPWIWYDYHGARAYAKSLGGYLVAINNAAEQTFVTANFNPLAGHKWIGLTDEVSEGTFAWDSGEPVTYLNWAPGQPDNAGGAEDHAHTWSAAGQWNDAPSPTLQNATTVTHEGIVELPFGERVNFDLTSPVCGSLGNVIQPLGYPYAPEGVTWNGAGVTANHPAHFTNVVGYGMPVNGQNFLRITANGPATVAGGGPFPRPAPLAVNEVRVRIPAGSQGVSLAYDFFNAEGPQQSFYNDGMSIAVVDSAGVLVQDVFYTDTYAPLAAGTTTFGYCNNNGATEIAPPGAKTLTSFLPTLQAPMWLSICCWNAGDNAVASCVHVDAIQFWGDGKFRLDITNPTVSGSIQFANSGGNAGDTYLTAVTLAGGAFPYGWFFGVDLPVADILAEVAVGPPFYGTLGATGSSLFTVSSGVPSGLTVYAVSVRLSGGQVLDASLPRFFLTP